MVLLLHVAAAVGTVAGNIPIIRGLVLYHHLFTGFGIGGGNVGFLYNVFRNGSELHPVVLHHLGNGEVDRKAREERRNNRKADRKIFAQS